MKYDLSGLNGAVISSYVYDFLISPTHSIINLKCLTVVREAWLISSHDSFYHSSFNLYSSKGGSCTDTSSLTLI